MMFKYSDKQLSAMAKETIQAINERDPRGKAVIMITAHKTGLHPQAVFNAIVKLSEVGK